MNYSNRGTAALAEMSPFSRPALGSRPAAAPMVAVSGTLSSWREPTYPLVGFDAGSFLSNNKVAVALAAAALAGGLAYYYGYR